MGVTIRQTAMVVAISGLLSFILGVIAETRRPASGTPTPIEGKGIVICKYPTDLTVVLGYLSLFFLVASTSVGYFSLFYPYQGKSVPQSALFQSTYFVVFFNIALITSGAAAALLLWQTVEENLYLTRNVHKDLNTTCPTAKKGVIGGAAFVSLDSCLFWLVSLMLADNARHDYFDDDHQPEDHECDNPTNHAL